MKTKLIALATIAALSSGFGASAHAAPMSLVAGSITINFENMLDQGTIGYSDPSQANDTTATLCSTVAGCNAPLNQTPPSANSFGNDTWGIFSVSSIVSNVTGDTLWQANSTTTSGVGRYLTGFFYGLQDFRVDYTTSPTGAPSITTYSTGGQVDLYWNSINYNTATVTTAQRTAANVFTGITGGTKAVSLAFNPTADAVEPGSSYRSMYNYTSNGSGGVGYLDVISGSGSASASDANANTTDLAALLVGDGLTIDPLNKGHDVALYTTFGPATPLQAGNGWTVKGSGYADTHIPEPASLALVGLGLIGLGASRRRGRKA